MLKEEFSEILNFFDLDSSEKKEVFSDVLSKSLKFSEKVQDKLLHGTEEEKNEVVEIMSEMKERVQEETQKLCSTLGVSEDELVSYLSNPSNFSHDEWSDMQAALQESEKVGVATKEVAAPKARKVKTTKVDWIRS